MLDVYDSSYYTGSGYIYNIIKTRDIGNYVFNANKFQLDSDGNIYWPDSGTNYYARSNTVDNLISLENTTSTQPHYPAFDPSIIPFIQSNVFNVTVQDRNTINKITFETPVTARYIDIYPQTWNSNISFRVDAFKKDNTTRGDSEKLCGMVCTDSGTCNGRGTCNDSTDISKLCDCDTGFSGDYCDECENGKDNYPSCNISCDKDVNCSGNGLCNYEGSCICHQDDDNGYWTSSSLIDKTNSENQYFCNVCKEGYTGVGCNVVCTDNGTCNGNGTCDLEEEIKEFIPNNNITTTEASINPAESARTYSSRWSNDAIGSGHASL